MIKFFLCELHARFTETFSLLEGINMCALGLVLAGSVVHLITFLFIQGIYKFFINKQFLSLYNHFIYLIRFF